MDGRFVYCDMQGVKVNLNGVVMVGRCLLVRYYVNHGCAPTERYQSILLYGIHTVVTFICLICCVILYALTDLDQDSCTFLW